jgi:hypothetical protein
VSQVSQDQLDPQEPESRVQPDPWAPLDPRVLQVQQARQGLRVSEQQVRQGLQESLDRRVRQVLQELQAQPESLVALDLQGLLALQELLELQALPASLARRDRQVRLELPVPPAPPE